MSKKKEEYVSKEEFENTISYMRSEFRRFLYFGSKPPGAENWAVVHIPTLFGVVLVWLILFLLIFLGRFLA